MNSFKYYAGLVLNVLAPIAALVLIFWGLPKLFFLLLPFVLAYAVAFLANPLVLFLQKKIAIKRAHSSLFITVAVLAIVILVLYAAVSRLLRVSFSFASSLPAMYEELLQTVQSIFSEHDEMFRRLPPDFLEALQSFSDNFNQTVSELLTSLASPTVSFAGSAVKSVPTLFINVLIFLLAAFCFLSEWESIQSFLRRHMPQSLRSYIGYLQHELKDIFGSWLVAQFKIMFVVFAVLFAGLFFMRVKGAVWIAVLTAFLDFLPAFGVGFILWPWIAFSLLQGKFVFALGLSVIYILTQAVRQVLQPKIMGDTMGLPMLWTLLFLYLGFRFYGIAGMIFSVPVGMLFLSAYRYGLFKPMISSAEKLAEAISRLMRNAR